MGWVRRHVLVPCTRNAMVSVRFLVTGTRCLFIDALSMLATAATVIWKPLHLSCAVFFPVATHTHMHARKQARTSTTINPV